MMDFRYDARVVVRDVVSGGTVRTGRVFPVSPIMPSDDMSIMAGRVADRAANRVGEPHREIVARVRCADGAVACVHIRTHLPGSYLGPAIECVEPQCMSRTE